MITAWVREKLGPLLVFVNSHTTHMLLLEQRSFSILVTQLR